MNKESPEALLKGFAPLRAKNARQLILGSMPGRASLHVGQYYAHPRNCFWRLMQHLYGIAADAPYNHRCRQLITQRVAVWDVLHSCARAGSSDAAIQTATILPNDFRAFFARHSGIQRIYFNGAKAAQLYQRYVLPALPPNAAGIPRRTFPSSSAANALLSFEQKLHIWRQITR